MADIKSAVIGDTEFVYGICEVQSVAAPDPQTDPATLIWSGFGHLRDCSLVRNADEEPIENCDGDLRAMLLRNVRWEIQGSLVVPSSLTLAELGARIAFPLEGIFGFIMPPFTVKWQSKGLKMLDVKATHWDALGNSPTVTVTDA